MSRIPIHTKKQIYNLLGKGYSINYISRKLMLEKSSVYYYYKKIIGRKIQLVKIPDDDKVIGEFLGAFAGDGSFYYDKKYYHYRIKIHLHGIDDKEYAQYLKVLIKRFNRVPKPYYRCPTQLELIVNSKQLYILIRSNLVIQNKIQNIQLKNPLSTYSDEFLKYFVRGVIDTDGSVSNNRIRIKTISKQLMHQVSQILTKFQIENKFRQIQDKRPNCRDCFQVTIHKGGMPKFQFKIGLSNPRKLM